MGNNTSTGASAPTGVCTGKSHLDVAAGSLSGFRLRSPYTPMANAKLKSPTRAGLDLKHIGRRTPTTGDNS